MSWAEERRANMAAEREQDRIDRRERAELERQQQAEAAERKRRERGEKRREKGQKRAARRTRVSKAWRAVCGNLDTALAIVAIVCSVGPAFYFQLIAMVGAGAPLLIALALAVMLESGAQVATITGEKAKRDGRPVGPHRIAMWGCASIASAINAAKAPELFPGAVWMVAILALSSFGGVAFWELRGLGRHVGKGSRTKEQRAEAKARRKHEKRRRKLKVVWARYEEILTAHPFGTITPEDAWAEAWRDVHAVPVGQTRDVLAHRLEASAGVEETLASAERTPEALAVDRLLADLFPARGKGDEGPGGTPLRGPSGEPPKGGPEAATTLGRKGKQGTPTLSTKVPHKPLAQEHLDAVRQLAQDLGGAEHLSVKKIRTRARVGGADAYLVRLRDAVKKERGIQ